MKIRNRFLGRTNNVEEEIDLRRQTKKKIDSIEQLKEDVKCEVKGAKTLQYLNYEKNVEIVAVAKIELKLQRLGASRKSINFFKKSINSKKHLHLVL